MLPRPTAAKPDQPPSLAALALIALAFALPGLAGHDLWKSHDAVGLGIAYGMVQSGDYLVPRVAGRLWLNDPPLYHWVASAFGRTLQPLLEFHSAARLASGAFVLAAFALIYRAARNWVEGDQARVIGAAALLLLLGSVGLMVHAHEAVPELATLAALCGALAALPQASSHPVRAGAVFGIALGLSLLAANRAAPVALYAAVLAAHIVCPAWRNRSAILFLALSTLIAGILAALWPIALATRSDALFAAWWEAAVDVQENPVGNLRYFLVALSWFAWPAWPLALWTLWSLRSHWREPRIFVPIVAAVLMLAALSVWAPPQSVRLLPLLAPLALLAAQGLPTLRRGAAAALDWFGLVTFAFFTGLVWLGYIAMMTGGPARIARNLARNAPGFVPEFALAPFLLALALVIGWIALMFFTPYSLTRSVARWAAGIVLLWGTFAMLWMPWADWQKSYRSVALEIRRHMPPRPGCVAQRGVGVPQAAALYYHGNILIRDFDAANPRACPLLLVQASPQDESDPPGRGWIKLAEVGRPGDRSERYRLYQRQR